MTNKRYRLKVVMDECFMQEDPQGEWVTYDDHQAGVERLRLEPRISLLMRERDEAQAQAERLRALLRTLLGMHDAEVFVREPWDVTFDEARAALAGGANG